MTAQVQPAWKAGIAGDETGEQGEPEALERCRDPPEATGRDFCHLIAPGHVQRPSAGSSNMKSFFVQQEGSCH